MRSLLCSSLVLLGACSPSTPLASSPAVEWTPEFDQPIRQLEEVLQETSAQQEMNFTSANLGFLLDAKLHHLFREHVESLDPARARAAWDEQSTWLAERAASTRRAAAEFEGGSLASFAGSQRYIELTRTRIEELGGGEK